MLLETLLILASGAGSLGIGIAASAGGEDVSLDDGGLRLRRARVYIPYASLSDANVAGGLLGGRYLVLDSRSVSEPSRKLRVAHAMSGTFLGDILHGIEVHGHVASPEARRLAREGRSLEAWLADVDALVKDETTYRASPLELDALVAIAIDAGASIEARAAATYAVLAHGLDAQIGALVLRSPIVLPPLVIAAARCAAGSAEWIDDESVNEIRALLDARDREACEAARAKAEDVAARERIARVRAQALAAERRASETSGATASGDHGDHAKPWRRDRRSPRGTDEGVRWPRALR